MTIKIGTNKHELTNAYVMVDGVKRQIIEIKVPTNSGNKKVWEFKTKTPIYGFQVIENNLNPETSVTYIGDNINFEPCKIVNGVLNYGSWEKFIKGISYRTVVKNGIEQYKVKYDNPSFKQDGEDANLSGLDGDLFTKIKHLYIKRENISVGYRVMFSEESFDGATSITKELEDGYNQFNNSIMVLLQDLYLLLFKNRNSQEALGRGYVDSPQGNSIITGSTNGKGYIYGNQDGKTQMCFLGIEDLWGNKYQWVDGILTDNNFNLKIGNKNFNDNGNGYETINTSINDLISGYFTTKVKESFGYMPKDKLGSSSTGYCDYVNIGNGRVAFYGGSNSVGDFAGIFSIWIFYTHSLGVPYCSARLCFKNSDGVYIGNYLGNIENGKLRSISGKEPVGSKKIGEFRTYAQNNN